MASLMLGFVHYLRAGKVAEIKLFLYGEIAVALFVLVYLPVLLTWRVTVDDVGIEEKGFLRRTKSMRWDEVGYIVFWEHRNTFIGYNIVPADRKKRPILIAPIVENFRPLVAEIIRRSPQAELSEEAEALAEDFKIDKKNAKPEK